MKYIKHVCDWVKHSIKEIIAQIFTLLGFFIAWITLTGTARDVVGLLIIGSVVVWIIYMKSEGGKNEKDSTDS